MPESSGDLLQEKVRRLAQGQEYADSISNFDVTIDSRDIIVAIEYMESLHSEEAEGYKEQLERLKSLVGKCEYTVSDWEYGETLIHTDHFTEYAMDFAKDTGGLPNDIPNWIVIDEEATAENLKEGYQEIDFDGVTYYIKHRRCITT